MRLAALATGLLFGVGSGVLVADRNWVPLGTAVIVGALVGSSVMIVRPRPARTWILMIALFGFTLRFAAAVLLQTGAQAIGREGITGDDAEYARLAWGFAQAIGGEAEPPYVPPYWRGSAYLFGTYVYLVTALFLAVGPLVLVPSIVNAGLGAAAVVLLFELARRLFGVRAAVAAAAIVAIYPSLVLWSAINLKDALALFLILLTLWALTRFGSRARLWPLLLAYVLLWPIESLRRYVFAGLCMLIPLTVWVAPRLPLISRLRWGAVAGGASALLLAFSPVTGLFGPNPLLTLEVLRTGMSYNARTAFVQAPVQVSTGDTFVVAGSPAPDPTVIVVSPAARLVTDPRGAPRGGDVVVRPGDIVVVGPPETTPAPSAARRSIPEAGATFVSREPTEGELAFRTLSYLPTGLAHALFAPFPWATRRALDALAVPEMLVWYVLLGSGAWTIWSQRGRWQLLVPLVAYVVGLLLVFSLVEGNVGTLFRHRGMIIPVVVALGGPTLVQMADRLARSAFLRSALAIGPDRPGRHTLSRSVGSPE